MEQSTSSNSNLLSSPELSPLEQEVLDEYERLAENMKKVSPSNQPPLSANQNEHHESRVVSRTWGD